MPRSRQDKRKQPNRLLFAIPVVAIVIIGILLATNVLMPAVPTPTAAMDFSDQLLINVNYSNGTRDAFVAPTRAIGEPGGFWQTHQYDSFGIASHYPLYMDDPYYACPAQHACTFHVKSTVVHNYTLGDFMAVYGYPVFNQNDTLGIKRNGNYSWELCVGAGTNVLPSNEWGALVLRPTMALTLVYYDTVNGAGCA